MPQSLQLLLRRVLAISLGSSIIAALQSSAESGDAFGQSVGHNSDVW